MDATQKLAIAIVMMLAMYFGAAVFFVTKAYARTKEDNPLPSPSTISVHANEDRGPPGHFKLLVKRNATILSDANWRLMTETLKKGLQSRFGNVQILTFGDLVDTRQLGAIEVVVDDWEERPYWGPLNRGTGAEKLPKYVAVSMNVRSKTGANWDGRHRMNAHRRVPGADCKLTAKHAREMQLREMTRSMLDQLPPLEHFRPIAAD